MKESYFWTKAEWIGFFTLVEKEVRRFMIGWTQTLLGPVINAALYLLVFGVSLSRVMDEQKGHQYLLFLVPGLVALGALNNALQNSASSIMISKFHGDLQDLRTLPFSTTQIGVAYSFASVIRGIGVGFVVLIVGELFSWLQQGRLLSVEHPGGLILFLVTGCLFFGNLGIWTGFMAKSFDHINAMMTFIVLPLIYLGGVFFSLEILHPFWQTVAQFNPIVYMINGIRWSILGVSDLDPLRCLIVSWIFVLLSIGLASWAIKKGSYLRF